MEPNERIQVHLLPPESCLMVILTLKKSQKQLKCDGTNFLFHDGSLGERFATARGLHTGRPPLMALVLGDLRRLFVSPRTGHGVRLLIESPRRVTFEREGRRVFFSTSFFFLFFCCGLLFPPSGENMFLFHFILFSRGQ